MNIHTLNPYIRRAMLSILSKGCQIKQRVIYDYELIYVEKGAFTLFYNRQPYFCNAGQFILLSPGIPHSFTGFETDVSQPHIHFDLAYSANSEQTPISFKDYPDMQPEERRLIQENVFPDANTPFVVFENLPVALQCFFAVIQSREENPLHAKSCMIELLQMLLAENFPHLLQVKTEVYSIAKQLKDYIDAGQGTSVDLEGLEKQFSYSKYYLEREFKKAYGVSLMAYRNQKRMELAKALLQYNSVSQTAEQLGFTSIYVFSRAFKQFFGQSPTAYKTKKP